MEKLEIDCPHCGQHYELEPEFAEQQVICSNCEQEFFVEPPPKPPVPQLKPPFKPKNESFNKRVHFLPSPDEVWGLCAVLIPILAYAAIWRATNAVLGSIFAVILLVLYYLVCVAPHSRFDVDWRVSRK